MIFLLSIQQFTLLIYEFLLINLLQTQAYKKKIKIKLLEMGCMNGGDDQNNKIKGMKLSILDINLVVQQKISSGAYGDIWKCKDPKTGQLYAAKQIKLQSKQLRQMYQKQSSWLKKLSNTSGIVRYVGNKTLNDQRKGEKNRSMSSPIGIIVTEFYEISLYDQLKNKKFEPKEIIDILKQLLNALKAMHQLGCIHLDIKLENILCKNSSQGRRVYHLCDFGSCMEGPINVQKLDKRQKSKLKQFLQSNSTLIYRSPQMIQINKTALTSKADIWMLGCVIYMLVYRKHPFEGQGQLGIVTAAVDYSQTIQEQKNKEQWQKIISVIKKMLQITLQDRYSQVQILSVLNF